MRVQEEKITKIKDSFPIFLVSLAVATFGTVMNGEGLSIFYLLVLIVEGCSVGLLAKANMSDKLAWLHILFRTLRSIGASFILAFAIVLVAPAVRSDIADPRSVFTFGLIYGALLGIVGTIAVEALRREAEKS
ncbi:MAG: hypothetical protein KF784_06370 [Fimbriimonadaceae bacterium]|nr:hypothetical protein [Fimbriimonadaceae bacterium]